MERERERQTDRQTEGVEGVGGKRRCKDSSKKPMRIKKKK